MLNLELLQQVRDKILIEPEQHKQDVWMTVGADMKEGDTISCPTAACVAGWACQMSGDLGYVTMHPAYNPLDDNYIQVPMVFEVLTPQGKRIEIEERAGDLLGLEWDEAEALFDEDNSRRKVLDMLDDLIAEAKEEQNKL